MTFFKKIFGKEGILDMVKRIIVVVPAIIAAVVAINVNIEKVIDRKMDQVNNYMYEEVIYQVDKQLDKIKFDPADIKAIDITGVIRKYDKWLPPEKKSDILEDKMRIIRDYYLKNGGV